MKRIHLDEELIGPRAWSDVLTPGRPRPASLWGVAAMAPIHLGMDRLMVQQKALVAAGSRHTVVLADLHMMLGRKLGAGETEMRVAYYRAWCEDVSGLQADYVRGSQMSESADYTRMLYRLATTTSLRKIRAALPGSMAGSSLTTFDHLQLLMQCLDPVFLGVDVVFADQGQEKIYSAVGHDELGMAVEEFRVRPSAGAGPRAPGVYAYSRLSSDITGRALHESTRRTRISLHDDNRTLRTKVAKMLAPPPGQPLPEGRCNALFEHLRWSVFPWIGDEPFVVVDRTGRKCGYHDMDGFERAYARSELHPADVKEALFQALQWRLGRARDRMPPEYLGWIKHES